ncbi:MAG: tyrosine--tRNA ligase, partial [Dehalococcoidia bacterium]|nr:tyrosine--tRNA ligase [Dehalococcoidia bacterium]
HFTRVHQQHQLPTDIPEMQCEGNPLGEGQFSVQLSRYLVQNGLVSSNSELKRLVEQNGVEVDGQKISEMTAVVKNGSVLKVGKRTFVRIRVE